MREKGLCDFKVYMLPYSKLICLKICTLFTLSSDKLVERVVFTVSEVFGLGILIFEGLEGCSWPAVSGRLV